MRVLILVGVAALLTLVLGGCGESQTQLTPEQESFAKQTETQFAQLKDNINKLMTDAKKAAESNPDLQKALTSLETAMADAQVVIAKLRSTSGGTWDEKKAAVQKVLKDLAEKYGDTLAKSKLGGIQMPKI